jgi:glycosyltransferase involved in cell wall biosynthesis
MIVVMVVSVVDDISGRGRSPSKLKGAGADPPLIGIIIPMYNAGETIDATLSSVCAQTHSRLDIVVVDDGSADDCGQKVQRWSERDPRVRLVRKTNSGVAHARNYGASNTTADYLAFIDADDLWAPEKIEAQINVLLEGGTQVGIVYCWSAHIDAKDRVLSLKHCPKAEGWILPALLRTNVVGNGSSPLFKRKAFEWANGFDKTLRERAAQGCEDLAIYLRIAEQFEYRVVKRYLVGYRLLSGNMSGDVLQMIRSCKLVLSEYRQRFPALDREMDYHIDDMRFWLLLRALSAKNYRPAFAVVAQLWYFNKLLLVSRMPMLLFTLAKARAPEPLKRIARRLLSHLIVSRSPYLECNW